MGKDFLSPKKYPNDYGEQIDYVRKEITRDLSKYPNFYGIDFCDVSAGGIQVRLHHKDVKGYAYGEQATIKYDFSNVEEVIDEVIAIWEHYDTPEKLKGTLEFLDYGEKYGWD